MIRPHSTRWRAAALLVLLPAFGCARNTPPASASAAAPPQWMLGAFQDDYQSRHTITPGSWTQERYATYHVVRWNAEGQYLIARNDAQNRDDAGKWTRIDWMRLDGMPPYEWAYCISIWNADTAEEAAAAPPAGRDTPRTGCGGHPFTRMQRTDATQSPR